MTKCRLHAVLGIGASCLILAGCAEAEAGEARCASLMLASSGNEPELDWYAGILKSYLATYLFDLGGGTPNSACRLETRFEGQLDQIPGYVHQSHVVQSGQIIWSYEHIAREPGTFKAGFQEAYEMVSALDKAGIIAIKNRDLLEPGDPQKIVDQLCARETVAPVASDAGRWIDTVLVMETRDRIAEGPCGLFCQDLVSQWHGRTLQVRASAEDSARWAIFEGRKKGAARVRSSWGYTSPAITAPGYYERSMTGDPKQFHAIAAPGTARIIRQEDSYRYAGGVVEESRLLQSDGAHAGLVGLHIWFRTFPDKSVPHALQDVLTVSKQCGKGVQGSEGMTAAARLADRLNAGAQ